MNPLPTESAGELLKGLIGTERALEPIKQALMDATEGNPLFLEESVQSLVESGVLVGDPGERHSQSSLLPTGFVPRTIEALLASRIDRLEHQTKEILQCAAVLGGYIPHALLEAVAGPDCDIQRGVEELQAAEFLYRENAFPGNHLYV